jgi:hypothetical protein
MILLCHAFHCPTVQCAFISDYQLGRVEDDARRAKADEELVFELAPEIKTLLVIGFTFPHYAAMKVDLLGRKVMVWDFAQKQSHQSAKVWMKHVVAVIRMHRPKEVAVNGHNIIYPSKKQLDLHKHDEMPLWTVQGVVGTYLQTDEYSCGALAINQFAKLLRETSNGTILGDGIDQFLDFKDTSDENVANAKSLLLLLLEKRFDCFELMTDGDETHESEEVNAAQVIHSLREDGTDVVNHKDDKTLVPPESEESTETEEDKDESADTLKRIQDIPSREGVPKKENKIPCRQVKLLQRPH